MSLKSNDVSCLSGWRIWGGGLWIWVETSLSESKLAFLKLLSESKVYISCSTHFCPLLHPPWACDPQEDWSEEDVVLRLKKVPQPCYHSLFYCNKGDNWIQQLCAKSLEATLTDGQAPSTCQSPEITMMLNDFAAMLSRKTKLSETWCVTNYQVMGSHYKPYFLHGSTPLSSSPWKAQ